MAKRFSKMYGIQYEIKAMSKCLSVPLHQCLQKHHQSFIILC